MIPHLLCYQGLAVDDYGFALDISNLRNPRLSLIRVQPKIKCGSMSPRLANHLFIDIPTFFY
jgi:hypothetical protein